MTKSTITREQLLEIIETDHVQCGEASYLARMALAAMDGEPEELPLDYLQGHKDGLDWAAQLAESNHPQTGDWLYDDPIELAKAIRKGPDMPPAQLAPVVPDELLNEIDDLLSVCRVYACRSRRNGSENDIPRTEKAQNWLMACRAAMLEADPQLPGSDSAPVPGSWIPVSERIPEDRKQVILWDAEIGEVTSGHYSHKTQTFYHCGDAIENEITHWMPLPAAPQEVK